MLKIASLEQKTEESLGLGWVRVPFARLPMVCHRVHSVPPQKLIVVFMLVLLRQQSWLIWCNLFVFFACLWNGKSCCLSSGGKCAGCVKIDVIPCCGNGVELVFLMWLSMLFHLLYCKWSWLKVLEVACSTSFIASACDLQLSNQVRPLEFVNCPGYRIVKYACVKV